MLFQELVILELASKLILTGVLLGVFLHFLATFAEDTGLKFLDFEVVVLKFGVLGLIISFI